MKRLKNKITAVEGDFLKEYRVTGGEIQVMVRTDDGRKYHAPKEDWVVVV